MKNTYIAAVILYAAVPLTTPAAIFTSDTSISYDDHGYDGQGIVISNCTVTVEGLHSFSGVQVQAGGVLTHSYWPNGALHHVLNIAAEPHILSDTNTATLSQSNVILESVIVRSGAITYSNSVDYDLWSDGGATFLERRPASSIPDGAEVLVDYSTT